MEDKWLDNWFNNTVITKQVHTKEVLIARFQHPGRINYSITYTFLAHPWSIQVCGDAGQAVFTPTWVPTFSSTSTSFYRNTSTEYLLEKLNACSDPEPEFTEESINEDWKEYFISNYESEPERLETMREMVDKYLISNLDATVSERLDLLKDDPNNIDWLAFLEDEDIYDLSKIGSRPNRRMIIWTEGLRVLEKYNVFHLNSPEKIIIGNPNEFKG